MLRFLYTAALRMIETLEAPYCRHPAVHLNDEFIYVFCLFGALGEETSVQYRQYERQVPFLLLTVFSVDGLDGARHSLFSENDNCFYVVDENNYPVNIWKMRLDDRLVTKFLTFHEFGKTVATSPDGGLFVLSGSWEPGTGRLDIYGSDSGLVRSIALPVGIDWRYTAVQVVGQQIYISRYYALGFKQPSWIGRWQIDRLEDGVEAGEFIWIHWPRAVNKTDASVGNPVTVKISVVSLDFDAFGERLYASMSRAEYQKCWFEWPARGLSCLDVSVEAVLLYPCRNETVWCVQSLVSVETGLRASSPATILFDAKEENLITVGECFEGALIKIYSVRPTDSGAIF